MPINESMHIIAIGASAGSMGEINSFFDRTPPDGVSYVIVQHLSPDFKSRMVELLNRHSKLLVCEAEEGMTVKSNQVYLIPNNKFMTIQNRKLYLTDKNKIHGPHLTINRFFNSLAADFGKKAIAVILSGLGADGTEGIRAIKKAGGMVMARNPETTEFSSMPENAIATGMVDFVMEPELMPGKIEDYVKNKGKIISEEQEDEKNVTAIIKLIKEQLPLDFSGYKQNTILRRIKRRAAYNNFTKLDNYLAFLKVTPDEVETLAKDFLISVTAFFRDKEAFEIIKTTVLPVLFKKLTAEEELKIWVPGCATGEEAYSIAILIREQLTGAFKDTVIKIFATDIDIASLAHAGKGLYNADITKHVSPGLIEKYFLPEGEKYRVKPIIRKMVIFAQHDLVKNPPYCNMHFISCRNLLIYMTPALQKKIFLMLLFGLKADGYLFLGSSENPMPIMQNLEVINKKWKIYKNLETKRFVRFDTFSLPVLIDKKHTTTMFSRENTLPDTANNLTEAVNTSLVNELIQLVICVDENNIVVKSYGDTTKYLLQKNFNSNLAELLPRPLAVAFNTLSNSVSKTNIKASVGGVKIKYGESVINVHISVSPLIVKNGLQQLQMVTITEEKSIAPVTDEEKVFDEKIYLDQYTINLEEELAELKEKLQSTYLQLDASNENMQSFNEELLSANEEMQSTNEEMQSVNEELHSINADYQLKNKELLELNDDLNNYFRSNINGQLFVNEDLLLMKFSPGTVKQINLLPNDVGRPLSNISTNIKFETIIQDIQKVIEEGTVITKEIETSNGKWYQIMTMPYIQQADSKITGAIITFNDITELKKTQLELKSQLRKNGNLDNLIYTATSDLLKTLDDIEPGIKNWTGVKATGQLPGTYADIVINSVKKTRSIINDILVIAKIENEIPATETVDLNELISSIEWSLNDKIKLTGTIIKRELEVKQVLFSKKNLWSILYNLVSNSIKFKSEHTPLIIIRTAGETERVILSVQDNGTGIPKNDLSAIFNIRGNLRADTEQHGMGLYLAKKVVEATGGTMTAESETGKGATFTFYLKA